MLNWFKAIVSRHIAASRVHLRREAAPSLKHILSPFKTFADINAGYFYSDAFQRYDAKVRRETRALVEISQTLVGLFYFAHVVHLVKDGQLASAGIWAGAVCVLTV